MSFLESVGLDLPVVTQLGGHSHPRTHSNKSGGNVGSVIMKALLEKLGTRARLMTSSRLQRVDTDPASGRVSGVVYLDSGGCDQRLACDAVVLATGGFAANRKLLAEVCGTQARLTRTLLRSDFTCRPGPFLIMEARPPVAIAAGRVSGDDKRRMGPRGGPCRCTGRWGPARRPGSGKTAGRQAIVEDEEEARLPGDDNGADRLLCHLL